MPGRPRLGYGVLAQTRHMVSTSGASVSKRSAALQLGMPRVALTRKATAESLGRRPRDTSVWSICIGKT
eukprot:CAMPEP_0175781828 /NCGR_PEP_ID=MMETSP0097-20121207/77468_1 /TAXON_ID=311494 /ORGANISM="Alexandrium monilatum, Strain CCMP3105" /LENGTH=68 /DNA_ID=CAMNT_0017092629 /DNA_START=75 /DNA_END=277 /DNA_ORIENTATION=-